MALRVTARTPLRPTEDAERVRGALLAVFPDADVETAPGELVARTASVARLRDLVRAQRIPDTARGQMLHGLSEDGRRADFVLGKQAAAVGRAFFGAVRSPLGDIDVRIEGDEAGEVERAIYHVAHDTTVAPELAEIPPSMRPAG